MLLLEIVLLSFPVVVPVLKSIVAAIVESGEGEEPKMEQLVTVLLVASAMKRIVLVPAAVPVFVLEIVKELPPELSPFIVTLSAPFKSISGTARFPVIVRAPTGEIEMDVYEAEPEPLAFSAAERVSVGSPVILIVIVPLWVPPLIAVNAKFKAV
jgi:hypothetical protein